MHFEEIYDKSYQRVVNRTIDNVEFFEAFYQNFLNSSERVRNFFVDTDMDVQRRMLKKSFYHLLVFYGSNQADAYINKIAVSHNRHHLNVPPDFYDLWIDQLVVTVKSFDPEFSHNVELAWRLVLAPGITYMKFKYDHCDDGEH